jgi:hypothetical protein
MRGLPSLGFFDGKGNLVVAVPPSEHTVAQFRDYGARAQQMLQWREAAAGEPRAAAAWLIAQLEESQLTRAAATARRQQLPDETPAERSRLDALLLDLRIGEELSTVHSDPQRRRELGARYRVQMATGPRPSPAVSRGFWFVILEHCEAARDVPGFELGLEGLRRNIERTGQGSAWGSEMLGNYEAKLAKMRQAK